MRIIEGTLPLQNTKLLGLPKAVQAYDMYEWIEWLESSSLETVEKEIALLDSTISRQRANLPPLHPSLL